MIKTIENESIFDENINRGINNKLITLDGKGKIVYNCSRKYSTKFNNPEEKVRASYFVELVLDYQYNQGLIDIEVKVERASKHDDRADIVVYKEQTKTTPYLVVETKKEGISDEEFNDAIEQAFGNANSKGAEYLIVVAGNTKKAFIRKDHGNSERVKNVIADIPIKFGKAPKYRFVKGESSKDLNIAYREDLISALKKSHTSVWQGGTLAPTYAFDEVSKLIFCKLKDEKITKNKKHYEFQIGTHETPTEVGARIQNIYEQAKNDDPKVFQDRINLTPEIIYNVVEHLQGLSLSKTDLDTKGVAFEIFMKDFFIGKMGQYFTPRPIVQFCVKMLEPKQSHKVIDPSCGSGGFLLYAMEEVRQYAENNYEGLEAYKIWHEFASKKLFGIEINDQIARVCKMNMIIHDDGHTNVIRHDALDKIEKMSNHNEEFKINSFDLILSNPPFGAKVKKNEVGYIGSFALGKEGTKVRKTQKSEILFVERCIQLAKVGTGKIAIVVPEGIMTNSSLQYVRDYILEHCEILASVSLPESAFSHFGAGIKSSILFLRRKNESEELGDYTIFMAAAKQVGISSTGREEENQLYSDKSECIYNQWKKYSGNKGSYRKTDNCYKLKLSEIQKEGPLNATRYIWKPVFTKKTGKITDIASIVSDKITTNSEDNELLNFALIRMDELQNNPVGIENILYSLGSEIGGSFKIVETGDILLARLGPSMLNRKIVVVPPLKQSVNHIIASPEFIVIRPNKPEESYYIAGVLRTELMLKYMYSKTRGGTPSRYRLSEDDFQKLAFPIANEKTRKSKAKKFSEELNEYEKAIKKAEIILSNSHNSIEEDL